MHKEIQVIFFNTILLSFCKIFFHQNLEMMVLNLGMNFDQDEEEKWYCDGEISHTYKEFPIKWKLHLLYIHGQSESRC